MVVDRMRGLRSVLTLRHSLATQSRRAEPLLGYNTDRGKTAGGLWFWTAFDFDWPTVLIDITPMDSFLNRSKGVTFQNARLQLDDRCLISGRPTTALPVRTPRSRAYPPPPRRRRRKFGAAAGDRVLAGLRVLLFSSLRVRDLAAFAAVLRSVRAPGMDELARSAPALVDSSEEGGAGAVVGTTGNFNRIQFERVSWCLLLPRGSRQHRPP